MVTILSCDCHSEYQDEKYGKKKRVHNSKGKSGRNASVAFKPSEFRCTVCSKVRNS